MDKLPELPKAYAKTALGAQWEKPLAQIVELEGKPWVRARVQDYDWPAEQERHRIYSLLLLSLVNAHFNGNKRGQVGDYPGRAGQKIDGTSLYKGGNYLGHNIAALAVDRFGDIIDFDFNHNELYNSSVEHAESRLIRRVFSLSQVYDGWQTGPIEPLEYSTLLKEVTIYTTLESCAQCSGIMNLGNVKQVVYLQTDPGQFKVGNLIYQLGGKVKDNTVSPAAPLPISGEEIDLAYFKDLDEAFSAYAPDPYFYKGPGFRGSKDKPSDTDPGTGSLTSFLCTDPAKEIFSRASAEFDNLVQDTRDKQAILQYPHYAGIDSKKPKDSAEQTSHSDKDKTVPKPAPKTNAEVVLHCSAFFDYARSVARRGTPHK